MASFFRLGYLIALAQVDFSSILNFSRVGATWWKGTSF